MNTLSLHDNTFQLNTKDTTVHVLIKKCDPIYFTEKVIYQREVPLFLFLLVMPMLFVLLLLLMTLNVVHSLWNRFLFLLFREKPRLISPEEAQKRLRERSLIAKMTPEEKAKLFSKKDLPLGL